MNVLSFLVILLVANEEVFEAFFSGFVRLFAFIGRIKFLIHVDLLVGVVHKKDLVVLRTDKATDDVVGVVINLDACIGQVEARWHKVVTAKKHAKGHSTYTT